MARCAFDTSIRVNEHALCDFNVSFALLAQLPDRGFGVIRGPWLLSLYQLELAGLVRVQVCGNAPDTFQCRLTGAGREAVRDAFLCRPCAI